MLGGLEGIEKLIRVVIVVGAVLNRLVLDVGAPVTTASAGRPGARPIIDRLGEPEASNSRRLREFLPRGVPLRGDGDRARRPGLATAELSIAGENSGGIRSPPVGVIRTERRGMLMNRAQAECLDQAKI